MSDPSTESKPCAPLLFDPSLDPLASSPVIKGLPLPFQILLYFLPTPLSLCLMVEDRPHPCLLNHRRCGQGRQRTRHSLHQSSQLRHYLIKPQGLILLQSVTAGTLNHDTLNFPQNPFIPTWSLSKKVCRVYNSNLVLNLPLLLPSKNDVIVTSIENWRVLYSNLVFNKMVWHFF